MVDLRLLAIAQRRCDGRRSRSSVLLELNVKGLGAQSLCGAEGTDDDVRAKGLLGCKERSGDVLLGLQWRRNLVRHART